ncbi:MAG: hypothetical protein ABI844_19565 [Saprospiraceae bacterium]
MQLLLIKKVLPYGIAAFILIVVNILFLSSGLSDQELKQVDMIGNIGMAHEAKAYYEKTGKPTYWTNSMFGGMPTYQLYDPYSKKGIFEYILKIFSLNLEGSIRYFLVLSLASFIGLCFLGIGPWLALIGAFAIAFSTNHVGLIGAGHLTKVAALGFVPLILVGCYLIFNSNWKLGGIVFTLAVAGSIRMNHIQMTYHAGLILLFYIMTEVVRYFKARRQLELIKPLMALLLGTVMSFLINYHVLVGLNSFSKDTMRGGAVLAYIATNPSQTISASGKTGLGWGYAMKWSEGYIDLLSMLVPGAVGGSSSEEWPRSSEIAKAISKSNPNPNAKILLPMYWGKLPFTDSPDYIGILIVLTFIIGLALMRGNLKWFAIFSVFFLIAQSLGSNFLILNKILFTYLPYYDKFRTPNSILNVASTIIPIFSMYGLYLFIKKDWNKASLFELFKKTAFPLVAFLIILYFLGPILLDMESITNDVVWKNESASSYALLIKTRKDFFKSDTLRTIGILIAGIALLYYFGLKKIKLGDFILVFGLLIALDLWTIAKRYVNSSDYDKSIESSHFKPRLADEEIGKDKNLSYRVLDLSINTFESSFASYFHKCIGGSSPTKLRRYQDMIDFYFSKNHTSTLNMMNTKYVIEKSGKVRVNSGAMGNAWFIDKVVSIASPNEEIESLQFADLSHTAFFFQADFKDIHLDTSYRKNGSIVLKSYSPNQLIYQSITDTNQVAVFSEIWYGPNKGWQAYIDGKPKDHFRVNYILRGIEIPAGNHEIEFKFDPVDISTNKSISYWFGNIFGLIILIGIGKYLMSQSNSLTLNPFKEKSGFELNDSKK